MKYLHLIWSNLKRKKVRTTLTLLSILIAFVLFGYMVAIKTAFDMGVSVAGADRLVVRHKVSIIQLLPESYEARIEQIDGVADATHATYFGGVYQKPTNFFAQLPVKPEEYMAMYPEFILPEEQMEAWLSTRTGAIAGRATAEGEQTWEFDLVGIYDGAEQATDTTQFLFRYDYFDEARQMGGGQIGWYLVRVDDPDLAVQVADAIDVEFANSPAETSAETEMAFVQGFAKQVGNIGAIMVGVLSAVFFTILLVAGNTMAQAVRERLNEIGVLKAIGFTDGQVLGMVLAESCLLAILGGGIGLALGWYLISLGDPTGGALPIFYFPKGALAIGATMAIGLGLVAGILPALQASRLRVADALRRD